MDTIGAQSSAFPVRPLHPAAVALDRIKHCEINDSDEVLMGRYQISGEDNLFAELVKRNADKVLRTAFMILKNKSDAEDATQECFLRLVKAKHSYDSRMPFSCWLMTILRNICRNELRRRARSMEDVESVPVESSAGDPSLQVFNRERFEESKKAFWRLSEIERKIVNLRVHANLEYAEIGVMCKISAEAAKKRAYRAIEKLRRDLSGKI